MGQIVGWVIFLSYGALIFFLSSLPSPEGPLLFPHFDKLVHAVEFAIFSFLFHHALKSSFPNHRLASRLAVVVAGSLFYAVTDEIHQMFVPTRQADPADLTADGVGIVMAAWWIYRRNRSLPGSESRLSPKKGNSSPR